MTILRVFLLCASILASAGFLTSIISNHWVCISDTTYDQNVITTHMGIWKSCDTNNKCVDLKEKTSLDTKTLHKPSKMNSSYSSIRALMISAILLSLVSLLITLLEFILKVRKSINRYVNSCFFCCASITASIGLVIFTLKQQSNDEQADVDKNMFHIQVIKNKWNFEWGYYLGWTSVILCTVCALTAIVLYHKEQTENKEDKIKHIRLTETI